MSREIARPTEDVFDLIADASNNSLWQEGMVSCHWTSEPPIGVGSAYEQRARFMGREIVSTFVVEAYEPPNLIEIQTLESTFPIRVRRLVESAGPDTCRVSAEISGGPEGALMKLLEPMMARSAKRSIERDYDRLVQLLESSARGDSTENSPSV